MKVCAVPGCHKIQAESRCVEHRREIEQKRGTRQQRGYGAEHKAIRKRYAEYMATGVTITCARCHTRIDPSEPWDLGHDDNDRSRWTGPEHIKCNRATRGRISSMT